MIKQSYEQLKATIKGLSESRQLLPFAKATGTDYQLLRRIRDGKDVLISNVIGIEDAADRYIASMGKADGPAEAGDPALSPAPASSADEPAEAGLPNADVENCPF